MLENGIIWVKSIIKKILTILLTIRSYQALNHHSVKRLDTNEQMELTKRGQDNMTEFCRIVPDECLIDLSERIYCASKRI